MLHMKSSKSDFSKMHVRDTGSKVVRGRDGKLARAGSVSSWFLGFWWQKAPAYKNLGYGL